MSCACRSLFIIMRYLLNSGEMKQMDKNTMEYFGIPSPVLMERAALCVFYQMQRLCNKKGRILVICGAGNNGGDGLALARLLFLDGYPVSIYLPVRDKMTKETKAQYETVKKYGISFTENLGEYDVIVDALFGIGLSRPLEGIFKELIIWCNRQDALRIAVDMPSGISADTGALLGEAFQADLTVTFGFAKVGQMLYPGAEYCGKVIIGDIGIDEKSILGEKPKVLSMEDKDIKPMFPARKKDSNKGSYGKVLVIAGSDKMAGAAYFSAKAAYLSGCGLVQAFTPKANRDILLTMLPEALVTDYDSDHLDISLLREKMEWADVILIGPGLGTGEGAKVLVEEVLKREDKPLVMDADALNILSFEMELFRQSKAPIIVTPHLGEMSRLTGAKIPEIKERILHVAGEFAEKYGVLCVLKDSRTVIGTKKGLYLNISGCSGMASGGSGDVLAGFIAGLLAQNMSIEDGAVLGTFIHGRAGEKAALKKGEASMTARDIFEEIGNVIKENCMVKNVQTHNDRSEENGRIR